MSITVCFPNASRLGQGVNYHVLKCPTVINGSSPQIHNEHLQVLLEIESGVRYWMTVNIRSGNDQVKVTTEPNYTNAITKAVLNANLPQGFTKLEKQAGGIALDYIWLT